MISIDTRRKAGPYIFLLLVCAIGYIPMFFRHFNSSPSLASYLAFRFQVIEIIRSGHLPWHIVPLNPDQNGVWYLPVWVLGLLSGGYGLMTLKLEFIFHALAGGIGMYILGRNIGFVRTTSTAIGASFLLSGIFATGMEHYPWVISAAWIPYVLAAFVSLMKEVRPLPSLGFAISIYFLITGGDLGCSIILFYFLLAAWFFNNWNNFRKSEFSRLLKQSTYLTIALLSAFLLSAPTLIELHNTGGPLKLPISDALNGAMTIPSFITFIFPSASLGNEGLSGQILENGFFGLVMFVFLLLSLFLRKNRIARFHLGMGILFVMLAIGDQLPIRQFLYYILPGMDTFGKPAVFKIFFIICFLVTAGTALDRQMREDNAKKRKLRLFTVLLLFSCLALGMLALRGIRLRNITPFGFVGHAGPAETSQLVFVHAIIQFLFLIVLLGIIIQANSRRQLAIGILAVVLAESTTSFLLSSYQISRPTSGNHEKVKSNSEIYYENRKSGFEIRHIIQQSALMPDFSPEPLFQVPQ